VIVVYVLGAILAFSILIIGHEFGHFVMAKANGVKVEEFSLGMGPKLFGIKGKETEYLVKALPIGGYVKMLGEEGGKSTDERAFNNKSPKQKLSIVAAGPIMNIILAVIILTIVGSLSGKLLPTISSFTENSPAQQVGIMVGDKIIKINNKEIESWEQCTEIISTSKDSKINIDVNRNDEILSFVVKPNFIEEENRAVIGITPVIVKNNFIESVKYGFNKTGEVTKLIFQSFGWLFTGKASLHDVGGPISIIKLSVKTASMGITNLLLFTAFLSVNLGILNIVPFPALDGGWILLLLIEIITGKKFDENKVGTVNYIGFMLLMGIMVLVTIKDILFPIKF
jgi:regulator of sigma E protease